MSSAIIRKATGVFGKTASRSIFTRSFAHKAWTRTLVDSRTKHRTNFNGTIFSLSTLIAACAAYGSCKALENDANITDDENSTVSVDRAVSPFFTNLGPPELPVSTKYTLLGYGVRSVTFVSFRVYALGIYIADEDIHLIPDVMNSKFLSTTFIDTDPTKAHKENVKEAMCDPEKSSILISNLLDTGVRMLLKVTPTRNTDFNHLRDGFIRTILNHPEAKNNQDLLTPGLEELKEAFTLKGKAAKNEDLMVELQANGSLQLLYKKNDKVKLMGRVTEPLVGKFLFSQYMSGPKPISPSAKDSVVSHITAIV